MMRIDDDKILKYCKKSENRRGAVCVSFAIIFGSFHSGSLSQCYTSYELISSCLRRVHVSK